MYGRWHAAQRYVQTTANSWCDVLNLDPRHRAAAGFGSLVVQRLQEELMASAWNQLGDVEKLNDALRAAQLGREASIALHRRLIKLPQEKFLRLAAPAGGRVRLSAAATAKTVLASILSSKLPAAALDPALRRIARPRGPLRARQFRSSLSARTRFAAQGDLLARLSAGTLTAAKERLRPAALFAMDDITRSAFGPARTFQRTLTPTTSTTTTTSTLAGAIRPLGTIAPTIPGIDPRNGTTPLPGAPIGPSPLPGGIAPAPTAAPRPVASVVAPAPAPIISTIRFSDEDISLPNLAGAVTALRTGLPAALQPWGAQLDSSIEAAREALDWLNQPSSEPAEVKALGSLAAAAGALRTALDPRTSIVNRLKKRIRGVLPIRADHLAPVMAAPEFPDPMYVPLAGISQDLVLPGIDTVPQNTLALLKVNPRFIESYMVGCNHEFAGELLWREYPTDQRGSYFRQFFEPADPDNAIKDIKALHTWQKSFLGANQVTKVDLVLLVRGDLLKKYPNTLVYAVPGVKQDGVRKPNLEGFVATPPPGMDPVWPMITGALSPDVTFFGFLLTRAQVKSSATSDGYYFVLEQRVSEPRFGIDEQSAAQGAIGNWNDLAWTHFPAVTPGTYLNATAPTPSPAIVGAEVWGASSAALASILMQDPVRVAVHADQMLPAEEQPSTT
jgi:hypothetical protein